MKNTEKLNPYTSLATSFSLLSGILLLCCALITFAIFWVHQRQNVENQTRLYGETVLENLVQAIELSSNDLEWLQAYVVAMGTNPGLLQIGVVDTNGIILAHTKPQNLEKYCLADAALKGITSRRVQRLTDPETGQRFLRIAQPVDVLPMLNAEGRAIVDISYSEFAFVISQESWGWFILALLTLLSAAIAIIFFFLDQRVIKVVEKIRQGSANIARGNFDQRIVATSNNELGQLAQSFNQMAETLGQTMVSKDFFNNILRSMADALFVLDQQGTITIANEASSKLLGYTREELTAQKLSDLCPKLKIYGQDDTDNHLLSLGHTFGLEVEFVRKGGDTIPALLSSAVFTKPDGTDGLVCVAQNISERKAIEQEVVKVNKELCKTNKELRTTQAQLIQTAKLASLGEMATGIAHELNQPLNIINMNAELGMHHLQKGAADRGLEKYEKIRKQVSRASAIINHLRTFGRDARDELHTSQSLNPIILEALSLFREQFRLHGIVLQEELATDLPEVCGNLIQLEQVLSNLLINARDAVADNAGEKRVTIKSRLEGKQLLIEVGDNGCGIAAANLEKIFDPFYTTKEIGKGTGLGLSISYGIIKDHNGSLEVDSKEGEGTCLKIVLPPAGDCK